MIQSAQTVMTIGHSTNTWEEFIHMLHSFHISLLVDIRTYPGSRRYPHFNKAVLEKELFNQGIEYKHLPELGGRRKPNPDSVNTAWRHASFKGYADYMGTVPFKNGIERLEVWAREKTTAYMCSEALWWKCHRALVSDYLKVRGWTVLHIMKGQKAVEHPFTKPARTLQGQLFYN